jgi:hypothetical protein
VEVAKKLAGRPGVQRPLVQILVVGANIQAGTLKAEAEKGFVRTAVGHESTDPKAGTDLEKGAIGPVRRTSGSPPSPKGKRVDIPASGPGGGGNANDLEAVGRRPGESSLFSLTVRTPPESLRAETGTEDRKSASPFDASGARRTALEDSSESRREGPVGPGRTDNRIGSPR